MSHLVTRPAPKFLVNALSVTQGEEGSVSIRMTFCGVAQYIDAKDLITREGWTVDEDTTTQGSQLVATALNTTTVTVVDRLHDIGLSSSHPMQNLPPRSCKL